MTLFGQQAMVDLARLEREVGATVGAGAFQFGALAVPPLAAPLGIVQVFGPRRRAGMEPAGPHQASESGTREPGSIARRLL